MKYTASKRSFLPYILSLLILVSLIGCGGGGSSTPLPDQDGSGIYTGTATVDVNTDITDLRGMVYNNRVMFFSVTANPHVLYDGTITSITSDSFTAEVDVYENGVKTQTAVAVTGQVRTSSFITGTIGTAGQPGNHNGTFSLIFNSAYNRPATTDRAATWPINGGSGLWTAYGAPDLVNMEFQIRPDSSFIVTDTTGAGCSIFDNYTIPDATVNIYQVDNFDIVDTASGGDDCIDTYEGTGFSGMFSLVDDATDGVDSRFIVAYSNGTNSVFGLVTRP